MARALQRVPQHPVAAHEAALRNLARLAVDEQRSLERVFAHATKLIASTLEVARVGIWLFDEHRTRLRCVCLYDRARDAHCSGDTLRPVDFPAYGAALEEHRAIVADDARTNPLTRELTSSYLEPNGITSMLDAPLLRHGEVAGVVCHEHVGPARTWTEAETRFAASVADIVALAMEQAAYIEARRALDAHAQRVEEDRRMVALGRVAAAVGHDFGHLLTLVLSHVEQVLEIPDVPQAARTHAAAVVEGIRRSRDLTRQLVELGRDADEDLVEASLDATVAAAADVLRAGARQGQRIEIALGAGDARVQFDPSRLDQVLMNLVVNALDATDERGTVRIVTRAIDADEGPYAVLEVIDDGAGIDDATLPRIFEPYFTTKEGGKGYGLGLAIVHALVQRTGGFIRVETTPGHGTSVAIHLPVVPAG